MLPGGYDFARDAYFARLGAVGSVLGRIETMPAPDPPDLALRMFAAIDRGRNALEARIDRIVGGEAGAVAAAMVTGKRDLLDEVTMDTIREAGIFHIITISGVQMTLVAGIFFWGLRCLLAMSRTLALHYPIKKWAAGLAMAGAVAYDIATGSRVGTERALIMTLVLLGAVLFERQALSMRNLAVAALAVIVIEPEALLGASFQLSFAAVAGLVAVYEIRRAHAGAGNKVDLPSRTIEVDRRDRLLGLIDWLRQGPGRVLFATLCATTATASFMAYNFHALSPYVLIGNPLTLTLIEFFAVPGALVGAALYPLGLDAWVWHILGLGISFVLWVARLITLAPGATLHVDEFAPWAIVFLALAVLSAVIWRSLVFRLTAVPLALIGIAGAMAGEKFDIAIAARRRCRGGALRRADVSTSSASAPIFSPPSNGSAPPATARCGRRDDRPAQARGRSASAALRPARLRRRTRRRAPPSLVLDAEAFSGRLRARRPHRDAACRTFDLRAELVIDRRNWPRPVP